MHLQDVHACQHNHRGAVREGAWSGRQAKPQQLGRNTGHACCPRCQVQAPPHPENPMQRYVFTSAAPSHTTEGASWKGALLGHAPSTDHITDLCLASCMLQVITGAAPDRTP